MTDIRIVALGISIVSVCVCILTLVVVVVGDLGRDVRKMRSGRKHDD